MAVKDPLIRSIDLDFLGLCICKIKHCIKMVKEWEAQDDIVDIRLSYIDILNLIAIA